MNFNLEVESLGGLSCTVGHTWHKRGPIHRDALCGACQRSSDKACFTRLVGRSAFLVLGSGAGIQADLVLG